MCWARLGVGGPSDQHMRQHGKFENFRCPGSLEMGVSGQFYDISNFQFGFLGGMFREPAGTFLEPSWKLPSYIFDHL